MKWLGWMVGVCLIFEKLPVFSNIVVLFSIHNKSVWEFQFLYNFTKFKVRFSWHLCIWKQICCLSQWNVYLCFSSWEMCTPYMLCYQLPSFSFLPLYSFLALYLKNKTNVYWDSGLASPNEHWTWSLKTYIQIWFSSYKCMPS